MIFCCGEALTDMLREETASGSVGYVPRCGGAVFKTAVALGKLGIISLSMSFPPQLA